MTNPVEPPVDPGGNRLPPSFSPHTYPIGTTEFIGDNGVLAIVEGYVPLMPGALVMIGENQQPGGITAGLVGQPVMIVFDGGKATMQYNLQNDE